MTELTEPTTRAERRAAVAAWRAVPLRLRFAVVRSAARGVRHPDAHAASAAEVYARAFLRPRGRHWWQRVVPRVTTALLLGCTVGMVVLSGWLFRLEGGGSTLGWICVALAVAYSGWAWLAWDVARDCRRLLAVAPAEDSADRTAGQDPPSVS